MPAVKEMTLVITDCRQVYSGTNKRGDSYTIFEVSAKKPDGTMINEKLRSFSALPVGQQVEVTVTPFKSPQHGRSFTLAPKGRGPKQSAQDQINELTKRVDELTKRVAMLEGARVNGEVAAASAGVNAAAPAPASTALDEQFGREAPW